MREYRRRRQWVVSLSVALVAAVGVVPALGNDFGGPASSGNHAANNGVHDVYLSVYLDDGLRVDTTWAVNYALNPHPEIVAYVNPSYVSANDVRAYSNWYSFGHYAVSPCPSYATTGGSGDAEWCKPREINYNIGRFPEAFDSIAERRHFACHELGHTLGLFHDAGGCMKTSGLVYFGDHNTDHLDFYG